MWVRIEPVSKLPLPSNPTSRVSLLSFSIWIAYPVWIWLNLLKLYPNPILAVLIKLSAKWFSIEDLKLRGIEPVSLKFNKSKARFLVASKDMSPVPFVYSVHWEELSG